MKVFENFDLTEYNGFRLNAICEKMIIPDDEDELLLILRNYPNAIIIGSGHNIILSKDYYSEPFILFNKNMGEMILLEDNLTLEVGTGAFLPDVSQFAYEKSLSGLEFCFDIPSSVGGAVVMNAGTKEGVIQNVLSKVRFFDLNQKKLLELKKNELNLDYRTSYFQNNKNKIITKVWFELHQGDKVEIWNKMSSSKERRWKMQPREYPSCGSVFKRPDNLFVGPMIESLGLKGYFIGGACISEKHAGFIINKGNATGKDILDLIEEIRNKIHNKYGVYLELEQRII